MAAAGVESKADGISGIDGSFAGATPEPLS
jgi:hypothetical protein